MARDAFDWYSDDIAIPQQDAIEVLATTSGTIDICQKPSWDDEQEAIIVTVAKQNVLCLIGALLRAAEMDDVRLIHDLGFGCEEVLLKSYRPDLIDTGSETKKPPSKDRTAAERQRRYRERKRNGACAPETHDHDECRATVTGALGAKPHA
jgi:hypothetical protein